jgi:hypothetical protein
MALRILIPLVYRKRRLSCPGDHKNLQKLVEGVTTVSDRFLVFRGLRGSLASVGKNSSRVLITHSFPSCPELRRPQGKEPLWFRLFIRGSRYPRAVPGAGGSAGGRELPNQKEGPTFGGNFVAQNPRQHRQFRSEHLRMGKERKLL